MQGSKQGRGRIAAAGAAASISTMCLLIGVVSRLVPLQSPLSAAARLLDSLAPWWFFVALLSAIGAVALGLRRIGQMLALGAVMATGHLVWTHHALSLPTLPNATSDLRLLFFNVLGSNHANSQRIVDAALREAPDAIVFAEGEAMLPAMESLERNYLVVSDCTSEACGLLIAVRKPPKRVWTLSLNAAWPDRYAVIETTARDGRPVFVSAVHLVKPWLTGIVEAEHENLVAQYDWFDGPVVAVGDFNAAPWSWPMRDLLERTGMRALRIPFGSWPARLGALGVPIDHVLVHNGARVVAVEAFGAQMGSNHLGFVADIALPAIGAP
jgi:endonuclease/exonuclease/phosphatase (EEP) superfamily protein YafD